MKRQEVKSKKDSGTVNDVNRYPIKTKGDLRYPFDLFCWIIMVSMETMKIVRPPPAMDID